MTVQEVFPVSMPSDMFAAMLAGRISKNTVVGCTHCPWMGLPAWFTGHLLTCPDQTATGLFDS